MHGVTGPADKIFTVIHEYMPDLVGEMDAITSARMEYHRAICHRILGIRSTSTGFSNADSSSEVSKTLAAGMAKRISDTYCEKIPTGQAAGALFAEITRSFLAQTFSYLGHLRPGEWNFTTSQGRIGIAAYDQYEHLSKLSDLARMHPEVREVLGGDYLITPDIVIGKAPVSDAVINRDTPIISNDPNGLAIHTPLRATNHPKPSLHASISCKWSIRSDRAQNTRTEALNLMRNRKGHLPHIIVVTAEPLPRRLASIALGTGDVDCTYHMALHELINATDDLEADTGAYVKEELDALVTSRRLRDISDLPFDLAI
jgi:hypothetical protein